MFLLYFIITGVVSAVYTKAAYYNGKEEPVDYFGGSCNRTRGNMPSTNCTCIDQTMSCATDIPRIIPRNINTVRVINYNGTNIIGTLFSDETWREVRVLDVRGLNLYYLYNFQGVGTEHLEELVIGTKSNLNLDDTSFSGLNNLKKLTLVGMIKLVSFSKSFMNVDIVPNLEELTVNPGNQQRKPAIDLYGTAVDNLVKKPLKLLNFSNVLLIISHENFLNLVLKQNVLNISGCTWAFYTPTPCPKKSQSILQTADPDNRFSKKVQGRMNRTISSTNQRYLRKFTTAGQYLNTTEFGNTISEQIGGDRDTNFQELVKQKEKYHHFSTVDFSRVEDNWEPQEQVSFDKLDFTFEWPFMVEHLYLNDIYTIETYCTDHAYNLTGLPVILKTAEFRNNRLVSVNCTFILDNHNPVISIDLSNNRLQYVAATAVEYLNNLELLYVSRNQLYKMQHYPEVETIYRNLTNLKVLDLSFNKLSYLPKNIFKWNRNLETLLLNDNELTSVSFVLSGLKSLQKMDLSNNRIKYIVDGQLSDLKLYFDSRFSHDKSMYFYFNLQGNPLHCDCKSEGFLNMIVQYKRVRYNKDPQSLKFTCDGTEIFLAKYALEKAESLCARGKTIVIVTISVATPCLTVTFLIIFIWRKYRQRLNKNLQKWFVREFLNGNLKETHLAFMAMSGNDDDRGLMQKVVRTFHTIVKQYLNTQKNVILTGYDFTPGFPIVSEAYRMIKASCVVIAFVSKSFCQSRYCMMELQEACKQDKPLILIFMEHIDENLMTPYMLEVFKRYARGKLEQTQDGEWVMCPSMDKLCEAMVVLAAEQRV